MKHSKRHTVRVDAKKNVHQSIKGIVKGLHSFSQNLWWSWNPRAQAIFQELSPAIWESSNHNPVSVLSQYSETELRARLGDTRFREKVEGILEDFQRYMAKPMLRIPRGAAKGGKAGPVAYFCAEFGVHESLPFYSGGLGILAGDHVKSASDLGIPFIGVGLFYKQGYFQQRIDPEGRQEEQYPTTNPNDIPVELVMDASRKPLLCTVTIGNSIVCVQAWRMNVGRSVIYLLDTDVPENPEYFRGLTSLAYGGDMNMRIRQEIVLGVGGTRFLRLIGVTPSVYHMNEGHAAFLTLELLTEELLRGASKEKAEKIVRSKCIFTTHTPVPAGHDRFPIDLMEFTLRPYVETVKLSMEELMSYGQAPGGDTKNEFTMTVLGLKLSRGANGVSRKHGEISRLMWAELFPGKKPGEIPIGHVTNGIHVPSWTTSTSWEFWERHNSHRWKEHLNDASFWKHVSDPEIVSDAEIWALRYQLRRELIEFVREKARVGLIMGGGVSRDGLSHLFSTDALTIGFARRFAPYKRAPLLFSELSKALLLFGDPQRPVQVIFAGKAHPRDSEGKELLRNIVEITRQPPFSGKVIFLENYDINVARHMVSGCDIWLNTPRRPLEASGTSGQKVTINTGLHLSVLDGWWLEAYNGKNGWAIGKKIESNLPPEEVDKRDADSLYAVLLNDVLPSFYERDSSGIPTRWVSRIRSAMQTIIPFYNTHRMVLEYSNRYYFPKKK